MKKKNLIFTILFMLMTVLLMGTDIKAEATPTLYKYYNKKTKLTLKSDGFQRITLNGKKLSVKKGSKLFTVKIVKNGKNLIYAKDNTGTRRCIIAYLDQTKPNLNVTNGHTYHSPINVKASDNVKVSSVTLNGKKVASSFRIEENGNYTVSVKDKAGNKTVSKFSLELDDITEMKKSWDLSVKGKVCCLQKYKGKAVNVTVPAKCYVSGKQCEVTLEENSESGEGVFAGNAGVETISFEQGFVFPEKMDQMFARCVKLKEVSGMSKGKFSSASHMFYGCSELNSQITVPETVKDGSYMFAGCVSLEHFPVFAGNEMDTLSGAFNGCKKLNAKNIVVPVTEDATELFYGCTALNPQNIELPEGVIDITKIFSGCTALSTKIKIPNTVEKADSAFRGCVSLETVPEWSATNSRLKSAKNMFMKCRKLQELPETLPENLEFMDGMFEGCENVTAITSVVIPDSVTSAARAFYECKAMERFPGISTKSNLEDTSYMFYNCTRLYIGNVYIPENAKNISYMFYGCSSLGKKYGSSSAKIYAKVDTGTFAEEMAVFSMSETTTKQKFYLYVDSKNTYKLNGQTVNEDMLYWGKIVPDNCEICFD